MRREIDDRTLEKADILMTNVWGQEELDKTAVFWEASLDRPMMARKIVDAGQVIRGEKSGRTEDSANNLLQKLRVLGNRCRRHRRVDLRQTFKAAQGIGS